VLLIVVDTTVCVLYPAVADVNVWLLLLNDHTGAAALTVNDSETVLLPPLPVETVSVPLYVPAASPVFGRTLTVAEPPAAIELDGDAVIS
jgi:hypothetical protein